MKLCSWNPTQVPQSKQRIHEFFNFRACRSAATSLVSAAVLSDPLANIIENPIEPHGNCVPCSPAMLDNPTPFRCITSQAL